MSRSTRARLIGVVSSTLLLLSLVSSSGCVLARKAYMQATRKTVRIPTGGMQPAIKVGQSVVIDLTYYVTEPIQRFDIVLFKAPEGEKGAGSGAVYYVKRVVGLGGETIAVRAGRVSINGAPLQEPYPLITQNEHYEAEDFGPFQIPAGEYFLLGDNRSDSLDSRYWDRHSLDESYIKGKVIEIIPQ